MQKTVCEVNRQARATSGQAPELTFYEPEICNRGSCTFSGFAVDLLCTCSSSGLQRAPRGCIVMLEMPHPNQTTYPAPTL